MDDGARMLLEPVAEGAIFKAPDRDRVVSRGGRDERRSGAKREIEHGAAMKIARPREAAIGQGARTTGRLTRLATALAILTLVEAATVVYIASKGDPRFSLDLDAATVAPELAYVTARYAALAPFGKVAALLSELLPISGAQNAGTVRNRTLQVGDTVGQPHAIKAAVSSWRAWISSGSPSARSSAPRIALIPSPG